MVFDIRQWGRIKPASPHLSRFSYEPLDCSTSSIRLLSFLPNLSDSGLIQCQLWHGTVTSTYTCLSYVWGAEDDQQYILINGRTKRVRTNLWDFMEVARKKYGTSSRTFWIDALCIDQESTKERNHQVAQMGLIYSNALEVVSWLGYSRAIGSALVSALEAGSVAEFGLKEDWLELIKHAYWKRAWITQEILLARQFVLWANETELDSRRLTAMRDFLVEIDRTNRSPCQNQGHPEKRFFSTYLEARIGRIDLRDRTLTALLYMLPNRECQEPRDLIYSLLSIASDTASISVNYGSSDADVLLEVLGALHGSTCVCFWSFMAKTLNYQANPGLISESARPARVCELPIKFLDTEFYAGPDIADWYDTCSTCHARIPDAVHDRQGYLFCMKDFCFRCEDKIHFYLRRHLTRTGERYTAQRFTSHSVDAEIDVLDVQVDYASVDAFDFSALSIDDHTCTPLFRVSMAVDALMYLLRQDSLNVPLVLLCTNSWYGEGKLIYRKPEPKCTAE